MKLITLFRNNYKGNRKEYRTVLKAIWRKGSPHTVLGKLLLTFLLFGPMFSLSQFFIPGETNREAEQSATRLMDYYIFLFVTLLTVMLWHIRQSLPMSWLGLWWFIPAWRIFDVVTYRLYFIFLKSAWKPWSDARRSLAIALSNLYEAVIAYSVLYLLTGEVCDGEQKLSGFWSAIYYSLETITTLGYGDYSPKGTYSRVFVICELLTGITFLIVIIPALIAIFSESRVSLTRGYLPDTEKAVQNRAFELYQQRGAGPGDTVHDWLRAEVEILFLSLPPSPAPHPQQQTRSFTQKN